MKWALGIVLFCWLLSGLVGAWMLDDLDADHWQVLLRGPHTLARALNENPIPYSGSN